MQTEDLEGQESIFGQDSACGKMSSVLSQVGGTLKRVKKSLGRRPHHGIVSRRVAGLPLGDVSPGQRRAQATQPGLGSGIGTAKSDFHGQGA